jgi:hypothetical protein
MLVTQLVSALTMMPVVTTTPSIVLVVVAPVVVAPVVLRVVTILPFTRTRGLRTKCGCAKQQNASCQK